MDVEAELKTLTERWDDLRKSIACVPPQVQTPGQVLRWGSAPGKTYIEKQAASFLFEIWSGTKSPELPAFDAIEVAARSDSGLRHVVAGWVSDPFWP